MARPNFIDLTQDSSPDTSQENAVAHPDLERSRIRQKRHEHVKEGKRKEKHMEPIDDRPGGRLPVTGIKRERIASSTSRLAPNLPFLADKGRKRSDTKLETETRVDLGVDFYLHSLEDDNVGFDEGDENEVGYDEGDQKKSAGVEETGTDAIEAELNEILQGRILDATMDEVTEEAGLDETMEEDVEEADRKSVV